MASYSSICCLLLVFMLVSCTRGESPYRFFNWNVTYGDIYPLGVKQQVRNYLFFNLFFSLFVCVCVSVDLFDENVLSWQGILINGQFPGPSIEAVTNDNLIISVFNALDEPFLISWLVPPSFLT